MQLIRLRTKDGNFIKVLVELLCSNIKNSCFIINEEGVFLRMMDNHRTILLDISLEAENFSVYKFRSKEPLNIGVNLSHLHKILKMVKKRDSIQFIIDEKKPTDLQIDIIPKEGTRVTSSCIKILPAQNIDISLPDLSGCKPIIVPSGEFQKMCKGLGHISNITKIHSKKYSITFSNDAGGVMERHTTFGEEDSDDSDSEREDESDDFCEEFDTEQLTRITKISGLSSSIQIYPKRENPLLFRSAVGSLGKISVYLKPKSMQEMESRTAESVEEQ